MRRVLSEDKHQDSLQLPWYGRLTLILGTRINQHWNMKALNLCRYQLHVFISFAVNGKVRILVVFPSWENFALSSQWLCDRGCGVGKTWSLGVRSYLVLRGHRKMAGFSLGWWPIELLFPDTFCAWTKKKKMARRQAVYSSHHCSARRMSDPCSVSGTLSRSFFLPLLNKQQNFIHYSAIRDLSGFLAMELGSSYISLKLWGKKCICQKPGKGNEERYQLLQYN